MLNLSNFSVHTALCSSLTLKRAAGSQLSSSLVHHLSNNMERLKKVADDENTLFNCSQALMDTSWFRTSIHPCSVSEYTRLLFGLCLKINGRLFLEYKNIIFMWRDLSWSYRMVNTMHVAVSQITDIQVAKYTSSSPTISMFYFTIRDKTLLIVCASCHWGGGGGGGGGGGKSEKGAEFGSQKGGENAGLKKDGGGGG